MRFLFAHTRAQFEIVELPEKRSDIIANLLEQTWLVQYPWPRVVINDRGTEFMAEVKKMLKDEYDIRQKVITTRNPQANAILERIHQTIGNMIRTFQLSDIRTKGIGQISNRMVERYRKNQGRRKLLGNHQKCWIWGRNTVTETIRAGRWEILIYAC